MGDISNADFSGWATKNNIQCSDGRTITQNAFQHQDGARVPLVWQHGHNDPENVLGHVILQNRPGGVYGYAFFNDTPKAAHSRTLVEHKDINSLSIWANQLVQRNGHVLHGAIREVSLVLSGANPGAVIEDVKIRHSDSDEVDYLEDEAIIRFGEPIEHSDLSGGTDEKDDDMELKHADGDMTVQDVYDSMTQEQKDVLHFMVGAALEEAAGDSLEQSGIDEDDLDVEALYGSMDDEQKQLLHTMVGKALGVELDKDTLAHGGVNNMNVFEKDASADTKATLSHSDMESIIADATKRGSLKDAVESYALAHGITDIDVLFPDAQAIDGMPQWHKRRTEWVSSLLGAVRKSPFSRIKTLSADLTFEEARAKGYVKGSLKREEFFGVSSRTTTPTTIYKKQKLDRDDVVDITDFDVVAWLKAEMRLMLEEELARAILIGDGRDIAHADKINESNIRPIASDHELFTTTVNVNISDASSSVQEIIDAIITNRRFYRGTGLPNFYTTETYLSLFLLLKDTTGRRIYKNLEELASELRVNEIVPVEAMEEEDDLVGILVNPVDYALGADRGGEVSMFEDFDIDYNQQKYLIETRCSGALHRLKSAIVLRKVAGSTTLVTPNKPEFNTITGVVTIPSQTGVIYQDASDDSVLTGAQAALDFGVSLTVNAVPDTGYAFNTTEGDSWTFTGSTDL